MYTLSNFQPSRTAREVFDAIGNSKISALPHGHLKDTVPRGLFPVHVAAFPIQPAAPARALAPSGAKQTVTCSSAAAADGTSTLPLYFRAL